MDPIAISNKTARKSNIGGVPAIVPSYVAEHVDKEAYILDFGCGPWMRHIEYLYDQGFKHVAGYEFGQNLKDGMQLFLNSDRYEIVYASNVFNTHSDLSMMDSAILKIQNTLIRSGSFYFNFPNKPNYSGMSRADFLNLVKDIFNRAPEKVSSNGVYHVKNYNK